MGHDQRPGLSQLRGIKEDLTENQRFSWFKKALLHPSPPFDIELDHVVLEELHLMRITDRLTENIITEVMERDS